MTAFLAGVCSFYGVPSHREWSLDDVRTLVEAGGLHHVTARTVGVPKLWIYANDRSGGFRGYTWIASVDDNDENHAYFTSIGHSVSVGSYGAG